MDGPILTSVISCPGCGFAKEETMPMDACVIHYECTQCGVPLRSRPGDCCVFCSFGTVACPPVQAADSCRPDRKLHRTVLQLN